ncbi:hypothetical protein, partial [Xenorhabdus bovienii]|uniref:hypothetical protein n=1 Tax=Xenorhabdus bovienii TaxID=40576 RepID=UPI0023B29A7E
DRSSAPCREAAYLTLSSPSVKPLFPGFSLAVLGGVSSLSVGQWWRIIGTFPPLTIVFFIKDYRLLNYTAKGWFIPIYTQIYPQMDISVKFVEHHANVFVTIIAGKNTT